MGATAEAGAQYVMLRPSIRMPGLKAGDPVPQGGQVKRLRRLRRRRIIGRASASLSAPCTAPVVSHLGGPWYEVNDGDRVEKVKGRKAADALAADWGA